MSKKSGTSLPTKDNPQKGIVPIVFQGVFTGIVFAAQKYGNLETVLDTLCPVPLDVTKAVLLFVIFSGFLQGMMASATNAARVKYNVPWPHTFALEGNKDKIAFDCVQRAHINFTENYTQYLAVFYFAACEAPHCAVAFGMFYLLGRLAFANGYYSGNAANKDAGVFGYMLGAFPLLGLMNIYAAKQFGLL
jgi:glutathione S-transferase